MTCPFSFFILQIHFSRPLSQSLDIKNKNLQGCGIKYEAIFIANQMFDCHHMTLLRVKNTAAYLQNITDMLLLLCLMFTFSSNTATVEWRCSSMINQKNKNKPL